jgi:hypothetical protein
MCISNFYWYWSNDNSFFYFISSTHLLVFNDLTLCLPIISIHFNLTYRSPPSRTWLQSHNLFELILDMLSLIPYSTFWPVLISKWYESQVKFTFKNWLIIKECSRAYVHVIKIILNWCETFKIETNKIILKF